MGGFNDLIKQEAALSDATPLVESGAGTAGAGVTAARGDHVHPAGASGPTLSDAAPAATGTAAAGVSANASRADHVHQVSDPSRTYTATLNLTNATIVGNAAGDIGNSAGIEVIAGIAGKLIVIDLLSIEYTLVTQRYGAGGNISLNYNVGGTLVSATTVIAAGNSLEGATSRMALGTPINAYEIVSGGASGLIGAAVHIFASGAFTDLGSSAGTAVVTVLYRVVDI